MLITIDTSSLSPAAKHDLEVAIKTTLYNNFSCIKNDLDVLWETIPDENPAKIEMTVWKDAALEQIHSIKTQFKQRGK